jgi:hypothetical protein
MLAIPIAPLYFRSEVGIYALTWVRFPFLLLLILLYLSPLCQVLRAWQIVSNHTG